MPGQFESYSVRVKNAASRAAAEFLLEASAEIQSAAIRNSRVATGQLKGSWRCEISGDTVKIGSPLQNAIWEEFGTGEFADGGNGRKGGWRYKDAKGNWHFTMGKTANHTLQRAFDSTKARIKRRANEIFKEHLSG